MIIQMPKNSKKLKLILRQGDLKSQIFKVFSDNFLTNFEEVFIIIPDNFSLLLEHEFLEFFQNFFEEDSTRLEKFCFVSQKTFFQETLDRNNLPFVERLENDFKGAEKKIPHFFAIIAAEKTKNKETERIKNLSKKFVEKPEEIVENAGFSTQKIDGTAEQTKRGWFFFLFLGILSILVLLWGVVAPKAEIIVKPVISGIKITQNIVVKMPNAQTEESDQILPSVEGILVESEESGKEVYPSLRHEYELTHANGEITIFNETDQAKYFIPSRLATDTGLVFWMQNDVTVPPKNEKGPGKAIVTVIAAEKDLSEKEIGRRGNIIAGTNLYFPGLRKKSRELYYAKANRGPLIGGSTLVRYFVGEDDFEKIRPVFKDTLSSRARDNLRQEMEKRNEKGNTNYILLEDLGLSFSQLIEFTVDNELIGQEQQTFPVSGKVKVSGLVFDQESVIEALEEKILEKQDQRKKLLKIDEKSISYRVLQNFLREKLDDEGNVIEERKNYVKLSVSLEGVETFDFEESNDIAESWTQKLKQEIIGKHKNQVRGILVNHPEIEEVISLKIKPFWSKKLPRLLDQIELQISQ